MTLDDIRDLVLTADGEARHYFSAAATPAYTYWEETRRLPLMGDDVHDQGWRFYVHRYTKTESDETALRIYDVLSADERVAMAYQVDHDPQTGYIHHIYECEGY